MKESDSFLYAKEAATDLETFGKPWKLLVVDDDPSIHQITKLALSEFEFENRKIEFIQAYSGEEALELFSKHPDTALILLDVIMETDDAGFEVIKYIRNIMSHKLVRIIMRTGQPGTVPAQDIVRDFDISDYKSKTDLTNIRLYTSVISGLRSYKELQNVESNNQALLRLVELNDNIMNCKTFPELISKSLLELEEKMPFTQVFNRECVSNVFLACEGEFITLIVGNGKFSKKAQYEVLTSEKHALINEAVKERKLAQDKDFSAIPININSPTKTFVLLTDNPEVNNEWERKILRLFAQNLAAAIDNIDNILKLEIYNSELEQKVNKRTHQLEKEKCKAEASNKAKSAFLSNMSHEIRTPMNAILGYTQLLKSNDNVPEAEQNDLKKIEKAGYHLMDLINDILDISKIEAGKMELQEKTFYLTNLVNDIASMFALPCHKKQLNWHLTNHIENIAPVQGDLGKLTQVLTNLVGNAIKFTEQGDITLSIQTTGEHHYLFEVSDTGQGIESSEIESLFDAFQQGSEGNLKGGTGLGLAISSRYIEMMGGHLSLETNLGEGSRFYFSVVLLPGDASAIEESEHQYDVIQLKQGQTLNVLIVDDIKINLAILSAVLMKVGITVISAENGLQAIEAVKNHDIDMVFMDILMPEMNGSEAVKVLRQSYTTQQLPCVAVTAYSMVEEIEYYIGIGFDRYISKPYKFSIIHECLVCFFPDKFIVNPNLTVINETPLSDKECMDKLAELPDGLLNEIRDAANLNKMSALKILFEQAVEAIPATTPFFNQLQKSLDNYDTDSIVSRLEDITK